MKTMSRPSVSGRSGSAGATGCPPTISGASLARADGRTVITIGAGAVWRYLRAAGSKKLQRRPGSTTEPSRSGITTCSNTRSRAVALRRLRGIHAEPVAAGHRGGCHAVERTLAADHAAHGDGIAGGDVERRGRHLERELADGARELRRTALARERQHGERHGLRLQLHGPAIPSKKPAEEAAVAPSLRHAAHGSWWRGRR